MPYSLILDIVFAALLVAALVCMARLNRRLDVLRSGRQELEALMKGFGAATEQAQHNVVALRAAADGAGNELQAEIERARGLREDLAFLVDRANGLADRLETAITRSRPAVAPVPSSAAAPAVPPDLRPSNVARMPERGTESRAESRGAAGPAPQNLSSGESELLRRLSTLR